MIEVSSFNFTDGSVSPSMLLHESRHIRTVLPPPSNRRRTRTGPGRVPPPGLRRLGAALMRLLRRAEKRVTEHFRVPPNGATHCVFSRPASGVCARSSAGQIRRGRNAINTICGDRVFALHYIWCHPCRLNTSSSVTAGSSDSTPARSPRPSRRRAGAPELEPHAARALAATVAEALTRDGNVCPGVETIQNHVEEALVRAGHWRTARAYIVHREQHARLRSLRHTLVDVESAMEEYLEQRDWRVNANANQGYSLGGLILSVAGKVTANYWLSNVFTPEAGQAHRDGDIHIHDLDMLSGYCAGWSLRQLLTEGFNGIPGKVEATPPRHMSAAIGQIVNFLGTLQNEWAGAQAFSSFDTYMAPFIRRDAMTYADVKQAMQELIYNLSVPSRWGTQTPFTNLTFDWTCPADLREQIPYIGGEKCPSPTATCRPRWT